MDNREISTAVEVAGTPGTIPGIPVLVLTFPCEKCDFKAGGLAQLKKHKENKHIGRWNFVLGTLFVIILHNC